MTEPGAIIAVCDAGPLIHLDELSSLDLLADFERVAVPSSVLAEVRAHRKTFPDRPPLVERSDPGRLYPEIESLASLFKLHRGEKDALNLMRHLNANLFLTDDTSARLAAASQGWVVHGTIGILIRSIRVGRKAKSEVVELLRGIPERTTLFIRPSLLAQVVHEVESSSD